MAYPAFAFYKSTQIVLAFTTCCVEFFLMYMIAGMILTLFKVDANVRQKSLFAFLSGTVLQTGWSYAIYFLNSMIPFTPTQFMLITTTNPVAALLYCWLAIKIFHLSPVRSVKMMSYVYIFWCLVKNMTNLLGTFFFVQDYENWNFLMDIVKQSVSVLFYLGVFLLVQFVVKHKKIDITFTNSRFFEPQKEMLGYLLKALFIYSISVLFPMIIMSTKTSALLAFVVNLTFFVVVVGFDIRSYYHKVIENNNVHISTLVNGVEAFRGIKHDFYNILQTYSGYLEIGEIQLLKQYHNSLVEATMSAGASMELSQRLQENPAFISLLLSRLEYAESLNVKMHYSLQGDLSDFFIDNVDICRMLDCLLEGAVDLAAESAEKKVNFSVEDKHEKSKLIIITNSTDQPYEVGEIIHHGTDAIEGDSGARLATVRRIIGKYGNCLSQIKYFNAEMSFYIEVQKM